MDGAIYLTDNYRIRRIGPDLVIRTVAGKGISALPSGNGGPATDAFLLPNSVAVGTDGSIYVAETYQVRRVGPDGIIRPFAGSPGATLPGDGQPAVEARLHSAYDVTLDANGNAFIIDGGLDVIRRVDTQGIITTLAGLSGSSGYSGDLGPAKAATLAFLTHGGLAIGRDGELFIADVSNSRVRKVAGVLPGVGVNDITLPSRDGREIYVFSSAGKHLRTLDAFVHTPRPLYEFDYVAGTGELASVTDVDGKITRILRDPAGKFSGVQSPYGQVTSVQLNAQGYLEQVASPETDTFHFTYFDGGLLATKQDPRGSMSQYEYDELGRLTLDRDPPAAGGSQSLSRTDLPNGWSVERTTHLGRSTLYKVERLPTEDRLLTNTFPKPTTVTQLIGQDGKTTTSSPDGTVVVETTGPDPRFGLLSPVSTRETRLPSGLTRTESLSRQAQLANAVDLSSLLSYSETTTVNGRNAITSFHPSTLTFTTTSPANRQSFRTLNPRARLASVGQAGFLPSSLSYDALGRLETTTTGARTFTYDYDPHGFVHTIKDALDQATTFGTDAVGRITSIQHPNNTQTLLGYDASGNLSSLTPPGKPVHELDYTPVNLLETYTPPAAGLPQAATGYVYDEDRQLASMTRPDGLALQNMYDSAGRLKTTTLPTGIITYDYHPTSGQLSSVTGPYGQSIGFGYDGFLNRSVTASGTVAGSVAWTFDSDFRIATESINNTAATSFGYDADSLLTTAGGLTLTRDAVTGVLASSALGSVTDAFSYDNHGAVATYAASFNGAPLYAYNISARDNLGRITQKEETIGAATTTFAYSYDSSGRLTEIEKNGDPWQHYEYDANGNRLEGPYAPNTAEYDAQDRLLTYGFNSYGYTANGELTSKLAPNAEAQSFLDFAEEIGMWIGHGLIDTVETKYTYDILGALTRVVLPDATVLDYVIDGQSRRVGKKRNGQLVQGFLYRDQLRIAAELDASSTIVSRFVYADKANVPELMVRAGATYRLLTDHLGSVRLVVNTSTGAIAQQMDYDAFGVVKLDSNPGFQPFGFAGGLYDPETELVRFGARDYDPRAGRWIGKDPIGFAGDGPNLYAYTFNDPVSFTDATGEAVTPPHSVDDSQDDAFECGPKKGPKRSKRGECLDRCEQGHQFDGGLLSQAKVTEAEGALLGGRLRK